MSTLGPVSPLMRQAALRVVPGAHARMTDAELLAAYLAHTRIVVEDFAAEVRALTNPGPRRTILV